jgi:hypothetical protein
VIFDSRSSQLRGIRKHMDQTTTSKKPRVSGEIDAYCTKCRLDLNHRIVAMLGETVKRVLCLTCNGEHNYRRPAAEREKEKERKANNRAVHAGTAGRKTAPRAERTQKAIWEHAITGQPANAFKAYNTKGSYATGELIRHTRFGDGVVARVMDAQKMEVIFEDGPRTMAQAMA